MIEIGHISIYKLFCPNISRPLPGMHKYFFTAVTLTELRALPVNMVPMSVKLEKTFCLLMNSFFKQAINFFSTNVDVTNVPSNYIIIEPSINYTDTYKQTMYSFGCHLDVLLKEQRTALFVERLVKDIFKNTIADEK